MSKFCIACGVELDDDAGFCTICGTPQNGAQTQSSQPQPPLQNDFAQQQPMQNAQPAFGQQPNMGAQPGFGGQPQPGFGAQQNFGQQPNMNAQGGLNMNNFTQAAGNAAQQAGAAVKNTFSGVSFDSVKGAMNMEDIKNVGKTKNKNTIIGLAACGAALLIVIIILVSMLAKKPYEKPIGYLFTAIEKSDGKAMEKALPDYMNEAAEDNMDDSKYDSLAEYYEDVMLEDLHDGLEDDYGKNVKISYKLIKSKEMKKSELNDLEDSVENYYDEKVDVQKGYKVKIKAKIKGKDDDDTDTTWVDVYKIDGKWCVEGLGSVSL